MKNSDRQNRFTQTFVPNSKLIFTLPQGGKIVTGKVVLVGTIVVAGGTVGGTVLGEGGPVNLVSRVIVRANPASGSNYPGGKVVDNSPRALLRFAQREHFGLYVAEQSGSTLGNGANGTYTIYCSIPIYWADSNRRGLTTALNADSTAYNTIQVEVDTADLTACFSGNNANVAWSGLQVQWIDDRQNFSGDTLVRFSEDHILLIPAAQQRALDLAMPQDGNFESWLILGEQSSQQNLSDLLLQRVTLDGAAITYDKYMQDIRQQMIDDRYYNPTATLTGINFIDFTGTQVGAIDASTLQARYQLNNVSGANLDQLRICSRRLFQPANYTPGGTPQNS